ncbi:hypothetical protein JG687_00013826, partial [Phytophthora cactorum]
VKIEQQVEILACFISVIATNTEKGSRTKPNASRGTVSHKRSANQRIQLGLKAGLSLEQIPGKEFVLMADKSIENEALVVQYVGAVRSLKMYLAREKQVL